MNILQRLLSRGSQTAPKVIDELAEVAPRVSDDLVEVQPQVLGKGTSRVMPDSDEAIEAAFEEVTPTTGMDDMAWYRRMDPRLAGLAAAGLGTTALMMDGEEQEGPVQPIPQAKQTSKQEAAPQPISQVERAKSVNQITKAQQAIAPIEQAAAEAPSEQGIDYMDLMRQAQADTSQNQFENALLRAGTQAGAAIAGLGAGQNVKADYNIADALKETAGRPVANVKGLMETDASQKKLEQTRLDMEDEGKLRDSGSDISVTARDIARKLGINVSDKTSAKQLQDAGLPLGTLLSTKMAADSRREMAALMSSQKSAKTERDLDEKQRKFARDLRKEATTGVLGKQYATFATGQRMASSLEDFAKNPSGYKDYATLMGGLKSLQGDESVVREAEVRLGMGATSAINKALNYLDSAMTGKQLQPSQRKEMVDTIRILTDASKKQYMYSVQPILEQAQMEGIDPRLILSGSLSDAKSSEPQGLTTATVKVRRIADGVTKEVSAASAANMDKSKYEIIK